MVWRTYILVPGLLVFGVLLTCPSHAQDIDGHWTPWSSLTTKCSKTCDGGFQKKVRSCSNPTPEGNGAPCVMENGMNTIGVEYQEMLCNTQSCWDGDWSEWGNCTVFCGRGKEFRWAMCNGTNCTNNQAKSEQRDCNTWSKPTCPSPCITMKCPEYGVCHDRSTEEDPKAVCICTMGYTMRSDKKACIRPPPTKPTPRPIPTLPPEQKVVATVISKTASTVLIVCVSICLGIFLFLRIFTPDRVIQMNMEIALLLAHCMLMFPASITETPTLCRIVSILVHFFFTACFMFMFLEALHMYSFVAFVVNKDGMFSRAQNTLVGWGMAAFIILFCTCFEFDNYGGEYHCWLQMNTPLVYGQLIPIVSLVVITFTLIEAAGANEYKPLKGMDKGQLISAKFSQRTNLIIMPFVFAHLLVGMFSEYEQNLPLYGVFSILNSVTGVLVLFLHCTNNQQVRMKMKALYASMCKSSGAR
ncbi:putative adhesion G protein-coupled receptor E4P [Panulirus ornatus]|uniref:putative adhesion G protein-coupled receptor E4P n=1 Tax=Panulirus ornatus TaxID=150431 RepID=UPI003A87B4E6